MRFLACVLVILAWLGSAALAAPVQPDLENKEKPETDNGIADPFYPGLPAKTLKIRYRLSGRFEGQEVLAAKKGEQGVLKVREIRATDTALGMERPIHRWFLETPEFILELDLVLGRKEIRPNIRKMMSDAWKKLTEEQKINLNENLPSVGRIVGQELKLSVAVADYEATFLGLATAKVALGGGRVWYWAKSDVVLKTLGNQGGFNWTKEAIDVVQNQELNDALFQLPAGGQEGGSLEVPAEDLAWAQSMVDRVVALLAKPLVGLNSSSGAGAEAKSTYRLPVPWPFPEPPGFRESNARFRLSPDWAPYPTPPDQRTWPPPGLGVSLLKAEVHEIAQTLLKRMPSLLPPEDVAKALGQGGGSGGPGAPPPGKN